MRGSNQLSAKTTRLTRLVEGRYGIDLAPYSGDFEHIVEIARYYSDKLSFLKQMLGESAMTISEDYARTYLISEAARMILREIAPKRIKKRKG